MAPLPPPELAGKKKNKYDPAIVPAGAPMAPRSRRFIVFLLFISGTMAGAPAAARILNVLNALERHFIFIPDFTFIAFILPSYHSTASA